MFAQRRLHGIDQREEAVMRLKGLAENLFHTPAQGHNFRYVYRN